MCYGHCGAALATKRVYVMSNSYEKELERSRVLVYGVAGDTAIKTRIAPIYTEERLASGQELYQAAKVASSAQVEERLQSAAATREFNAVKDEIHEGYVKARNAARYFFKGNRNVYELLLLDQSIPKAFAEWRKSVTHTFKAIGQMPDIQEKLTLVGLSPEVVAAYVAKTEKIDDLRLKAEREDGEAQQASVKKQETFDELSAFCIDLRECLNLFYQGNERQALEKVGITVK